MGIETGTLMAIAAMGSAAASVYTAMNQPKPPGVQAPVKPPQASKTPDQAGIASKNLSDALPGGPLTGNAGTFLTGAGGVDPSTLTLGKNTLLGQ